LPMMIRIVIKNLLIRPEARPWKDRLIQKQSSKSEPLSNCFSMNYCSKWFRPATHAQRMPNACRMMQLSAARQIPRCCWPTQHEISAGHPVLQLLN
jgi:hypothetical protein